jgi:hypothetical protein
MRGRQIDRDSLFFTKIKEFIEKSNVVSDHIFFKATEFISVLGFVTSLKRIETLHEQFDATITAFNVLDKTPEECRIRKQILLEISVQIVKEAKLARILNQPELVADMFNFPLPKSVPGMATILRYVKIHQRNMENNNFKLFQAELDYSPVEMRQSDLEAFLSNEPSRPGFVTTAYTAEGFRYIPQVLPKPHDTTNE